MCVFTGGFTLTAAAAVAGEPSEITLLERVASLLDNSLLRQAADAGGEPRYFMLETIREYGLERLALSGEEEEIRNRHAEWCLQISHGLDLWGAGQAGDLFRLRSEHDNVRAALAWLIARCDREGAQALAGRLWEFWFICGHAIEGSQWLEQALALGEATPQTRAGAVLGAGALAYQVGDLERAATLTAEGAALYRQLGDALSLGVALGLQGNAALAAGNVGRAQTLFTEEREQYRRVGHAVAAGVATLNLGRVAAARGELARAEVLLDQARRQTEAGGSHWDAAVANFYLARVADGRGEPSHALARYQEALARFRDVSDPVKTVQCLEGIAAIVAADQPIQAGRLLGAAAAWRERIGRPPGAEDQPLIERAEQLAARATEGTLLAAALETGGALSVEGAIAEGLAAARAIPAEDGAIDSLTALGLTRREREVLRYLVDGRSDRDIAEVLFISPKTVGLHVSHLLAKLGVPSRAAAVAYAHRNDLIGALTSARSSP
jgi:non-specific serine/threonine protein kinase